MHRRIDLGCGDLITVYYKGEPICRLTADLIDGRETFVIGTHLNEQDEQADLKSRQWFQQMQLDDYGADQL